MATLRSNVSSFAIRTNELGLQIKPEKPLNNLNEIVGYSDSYYAKELKPDEVLPDTLYF
jgi:hypothetical protein